MTDTKTQLEGAPLIAPSSTDHPLYDDIVQACRSVYDPEIPVNIYDLGLIYTIDAVGDDAKRKEYDEVRRMGPMGAGGSGGFTFNVDDMGGAGGLGDLFGSMFGRGGGAGFVTPSARPLSSAS